MPSRTTTTTTTTAAATATATAPKPHGQIQLQAKDLLPPSPSTSPDSFLLDRSRHQFSPQSRRFPLKNLRRKSHQPNLQEAASVPSIYQLSYDGADDSRPVNITELQEKVFLLTKNLRSAETALKNAESDRDAWKERARSLEQRTRAVGKENRELKMRNSELEQEMTKKNATVEYKRGSDTADDVSESRKIRKQSRSIASYSDESKAVRALISHHWNLQSEMATNVGKDADWCDCVASKTIRSLLRDGSGKVSPMLQAKGFEDVAKGAPSGSLDKLEEPLDEGAPTPKLHLPPQPQPEIFDEARRKRKEALKRRIKEVRGYVQGLKKENDVLEGLLVGAETNASAGSHESRRNEATTARKHRKA
ncbi:hypothetical protein ABW20_dc0101937 [Dactylellina cionopaga]|nr:hypothetical protein ABW20_dc0101937 [Dactylellina cionopaga]